MNWLRKWFGTGEGVTKSESANTATLKKEPGNLYVLRISGMLSKGTVDCIQGIGVKDLAAGADNLKLLIVLTRFQGWRRGEAWGDIDFLVQYGDRIAKIAVVGEPAWEEQSLLFLAAGRRKSEVRYFGPEQEEQARTWLAP